MLFCTPQIPHDLTWSRTRAAAVGSRQPTAFNFASLLQSSSTYTNMCVSACGRSARPQAEALRSHAGHGLTVSCITAKGKATVLYCLLATKLPQALTFIPDVSGSNLGRKTDYPEVSRGFPQSSQLNARTLISRRSRPLPFTSFQIQHSLSFYDSTLCMRYRWRG
jgi:hypothetical protein